MTPMQDYYLSMAKILRQYVADKKKEGFIPTIEMLIDDLEGQIITNKFLR